MDFGKLVMVERESGSGADAVLGKQQVCQQVATLLRNRKVKFHPLDDAFAQIVDSLDSFSRVLASVEDLGQAEVLELTTLLLKGDLRLAIVPTDLKLFEQLPEMLENIAQLEIIESEIGNCPDNWAQVRIAQYANLLQKLAEILHSREQASEFRRWYESALKKCSSGLFTTLNSVS